MRTTRLAVNASIAVLALAASTAAALAAPAVATAAVNVRTGGGIQFAIVDTLVRGEPVDVGQCQGSWCYITHDGPDGWVSSNYLSATAQQPQPNDENYAPPPPSQQPQPVAPQPQPVQPQQPQVPGINFGFNLGNGAFSFGLGQAPQPVSPSACFYEGPGYSGGGFCAEDGDTYNSLGNFGNRISSVQVFGGATTTICSDANLYGTCQTISSNKAQLGILDNQVSSLEVH